MIGLVVFGAIILVFALTVIARRSAFIEAPTAVALLSLAWIFPQGLRIYAAETFTESAQNFFWVWATFCVVAFWFGFRVPRKAVTAKPGKNGHVRHVYYETRLQAIAVIMVLVGAISLRIASALAVELGSEWTGPATLLFMFGQLLNWGFCLSMLLLLRSPNKVNIIIVLLAIVLIMLQMTDYVKRNAVFEIACIVGGSLYFVRRWVPSLPLLAVAVLLGAVLIHEVSAIRHYVKVNNVTTFEAVISGAPFESFQEEDAVSTTELTQAIYDVERARTTGEYDFGASYWDKFVHRWVPAFIVGRDVKDSLKFNPKSAIQSSDILSFTGATRTGFSDTFRGFSIFGLLVFFLIGRFVGGFFRSAQSGDLYAQYLYLIILNDTLIAFTEATSRFVVYLPWVLGVAFVIFRMSRSSIITLPTMRSTSSGSDVQATMDVPAAENQA